MIRGFTRCSLFLVIMYIYLTSSRNFSFKMNCIYYLDKCVKIIVWGNNVLLWLSFWQQKCLSTLIGKKPLNIFICLVPKFSVNPVTSSHGIDSMRKILFLKCMQWLVWEAVVEWITVWLCIALKSPKPYQFPSGRITLLWWVVQTRQALHSAFLFLALSAPSCLYLYSLLFNYLQDIEKAAEQCHTKYKNDNI